ncbi:hypothetical protein [Rudaea sp.]|uniref:hypothetical protein n=1 Tax=Rudaea sp. TaxID=2136325 RepID=UPI00322038BD
MSTNDRTPRTTAAREAPILCATGRAAGARAARALVLALAGLAAAGAGAAERLAPKHLLHDPALLKDLFAERIAGQSEVIEARFSDATAAITVIATDDPHSSESWSASSRSPVRKDDARRPLAERPCAQLHLPFARLDFAGAARAADQAAAIVEANGYYAGGAAVYLNVSVGTTPGRSCQRLVWAAEMYSEANPMNRANVEWQLDGSAPVASDATHRPVPFARLLAGTKRGPKPAAPAAPPAPRRDFLHADIATELAQIEQRLGAPLPLYAVLIDTDMLRIETFEAGSRNKKKREWIFDADTGLRAAQDTSELADIQCDRPFTTVDFAFGQLSDLIARAPATIPPMANGHVSHVRIDRSSRECRKPPLIQVTIEDERGYGDAIYDARGKLLEAKVR